MDAGEAHGHARFVAGGAVEALEGDLQHQAVFLVGFYRAHRAEAVDRVVAGETVDLFQFFVREAEIGLADGDQFVAAVFALAPDAERVVRIEAGSLAVAALGVE